MPFAIKPSKLCLILVTEVGQKARLVLYAVTVHQKKKKKKWQNAGRECKRGSLAKISRQEIQHFFLVIYIYEGAEYHKYVCTETLDLEYILIVRTMTCAQLFFFALCQKLLVLSGGRR